LTKEGFENILLLKDDALMTELLHIFDVLGVFRVQWPLNILNDTLGIVSQMLSDDPTYRKLQAFTFLGNAGRYIPYGSRSCAVQSLVEWYGEYDELGPEDEVVAGESS
jgi:hypothetical protein